MATSTSRVVLLAVDKSQHGLDAFNCKFLFQLLIHTAKYEDVFNTPSLVEISRDWREFHEALNVDIL